MRNCLLILLIANFFAAACSAQVQVSQEPRHHKVFENEWVRMLDVHIPPHDTTLMHKHSTPSVFMVLSNTKTGSQVLVEPGKPAFSDGHIWFEGFYEKPRIHRVWNEDTVEFHVIDMELLHRPAPGPIKTDSLQYSERLFTEKQVQAFRVTMPPAAAFSRESANPLVVVSLSGPKSTGTVNGKIFSNKGDFLFIPAGGTLTIVNEKGPGEVQFAVFVLH